MSYVVSMEYVEEALIELDAYKKLRELVCRIFLLLANRASENFAAIRERLPEGASMLPAIQRIFRGEFNYIAVSCSGDEICGYTMISGCNNITEAVAVAESAEMQYVDVVPEYLWLADESIGKLYQGTYNPQGVREGGVLQI